MAYKMATTYQFASIRCSGHSNLVIFNQFSSKFHIWFVSIKLCFKFQYGFCLTNDNQDGRQNGRRLSVSSICCCGHTKLVIFCLDFFQISYMVCLYQTLVQV